LLILVEVRVNVNGVIGVKNSHIFNFTTRLSSGKCSRPATWRSKR
jgi:hypothetical protein